MAERRYLITQEEALQSVARMVSFVLVTASGLESLAVGLGRQ